MNNPYEAPKSNLEVPYKFKRSVWWKVYFFIAVPLMLLGGVSYLFEALAGMAEYISIIFLLINSIGLFGFIFLKKILNPAFWLVFLIINIFYSIIYFFITDLDLRMGMNDMEFLITTLIAILFSLPYYWGIYKYSKPTDPAWNQ